MIPRVYGRMRVGGNIIWATDFREVYSETRQGGGGKGGGGGVVVEEYSYFASIAVAAHAQVCTRCKRISTEMCPSTPDFARDLVSAKHGCMQLHLHSNCICRYVHMMLAHLN